MQRLVQVTDKMNEVAEGFGALQGFGGFVFQNDAQLFDRARHAAVGAAVFRQKSFVFSPRDINVMPGAVMAFIAHVIGPGGSIHEQVIRGVATPALEFGINGILAEQLLDQLPCFGYEMFLCNERDRLVALATPGARCRCCEHANQ